MAMKNLSIAAVSRETGIGIETLRAWERRYGKPSPRRLPSGHRRYTAKQLEWLKKVARAIARGHAPSEVIPGNPRKLDSLLGDESAGPDEPIERLLPRPAERL